MSCTNICENQAPAGAFKSELAPETYVKVNDQAYSRSILQVFNMAFTVPSDESQQFLDIGCGTGDFTLECILPTCQPCRRIVAIDYSESMLKYAREKYSSEKILYEYLDINNDVSGFLKKHGTFQRVYSFKTLQWSQNLRCTLSNIADLLVPGGECLLYFYARNFLMESFKRLSRMERWSKYADVLLGGIPQSHDIIDPKGQHAYLSAALSSAGLIPYTAEVLVSPHIAGIPGAFCEGLFEIANPIYSLLSENEKSDFLETLSTHLPDWQDLYRKKSGPVLWSAFLVHARKPETS